jgi:hypothetical protein
MEEDNTGGQSQRIVLGRDNTIKTEDGDPTANRDYGPDDFQKGCDVMVDIMFELKLDTAEDRRTFFRKVFLIEGYSKRQVVFYCRHFMRRNATSTTWAVLQVSDYITYTDFLLKPAMEENSSRTGGGGGSGGGGSGGGGGRSGGGGRGSGGGGGSSSGGGGNSGGGGGTSGGGRGRSGGRGSGGGGGGSSGGDGDGKRKQRRAPNPDNFCSFYVLQMGACTFPNCILREECAFCNDGSKHTATDCHSGYKEATALKNDAARRKDNGSRLRSPRQKRN